MKKIGIVADNYKLDKFKSELTKAGFKEFEVKRYTANLSTIFILAAADKVIEVRKVCEMVELHFKRSN